MKNKILMLFALFLILGSLSFVNAEMYFTGNCEVTANATTTSFGTLSFEDTSLEGVGKHKIVEVDLWVKILYTLPYEINGINLTDCTATYRFYQNFYDDEGNLLNVTLTTFLQYFNASYSGLGKLYEFDMVDRDILKIDLECHYESAVDTTMCEEINANEYAFFWFDAPSMECAKCERYDFDEIITEYMESQEYAETYLQVFNDVRTLSNNNLEVWLIAYWIVRIFLFILLIMLIFASAYWIYDFFKRIARTI